MVALLWPPTRAPQIDKPAEIAAKANYPELKREAEALAGMIDRLDALASAGKSLPADQAEFSSHILSGKPHATRHLAPALVFGDCPAYSTYEIDGQRHFRLQIAAFEDPRPFARVRAIRWYSHLDRWVFDFEEGTGPERKHPPARPGPGATEPSP
jgi:hypothetical protein